MDWSKPKTSQAGSTNIHWLCHDVGAKHAWWRECLPNESRYVNVHARHFISLETAAGRDFPPNFPSTAKHIYRQLLRVFAHIYHAHYTQILHLRSEPHFNSLFAHFLAFGKEYELLEVKDIKGSTAQGIVGVGDLWERWRDMGILESWSILYLH